MDKLRFIDNWSVALLQVAGGKTWRQAGTELGQAQLKLGLGFILTIDS